MESEKPDSKIGELGSEQSALKIPETNTKDQTMFAHIKLLPGCCQGEKSLQLTRSMYLGNTVRKGNGYDRVDPESSIVFMITTQSNGVVEGGC